MATCDDKKIQRIEIIDENSEMTENRQEDHVFFTGRLSLASCAICGVEFERPVKSMRAVCSAACKRERSIRYAATYRQLGRDLREKIYERFGGRAPTPEDIETIIQLRKGRS
jgi:hypothetical protein